MHLWSSKVKWCTDEYSKLWFHIGLIIDFTVFVLNSFEIIEKVMLNHTDGDNVW